MLLVMASMTYARLDSFNTSQISEKQFESFMVKDECKPYNESASKIYEKTTLNPNTSSTVKTPRAPSKGTSKLSWALILSKVERDKDPSKHKQIIELSKKLIMNLFADQANVKKMLEDKPDILDRLFVSIMNAADKLDVSIKLKEIGQLASLEITDEELKSLRYELFKDNYKLTASLRTEKNEIEDTYSLLDHLTIALKPTRIFLASRALLTVIFNQDSKLVDQIIEERKKLYREVKAKSGKTNQQASSEFEGYIKSFYPYINDQLFDYSVTKTDPSKYE
jgi:hypothetical protein